MEHGVSQKQLAFEQFSIEVDEAIDQVDLPGRAVPEKINFTILLDVISGEHDTDQSAIAAARPHIHFIAVTADRSGKMTVINRIDDGWMIGVRGIDGTIDHDLSDPDQIFPVTPVETCPRFVYPIRYGSELMPCQEIFSHLL